MRIRAWKQGAESNADHLESVFSSAFAVQPVYLLFLYPVFRWQLIRICLHNADPDSEEQISIRI